MQNAIEKRKSATKLSTRPKETHAGRELKAMKAYMKKVTSSKKAAQSFLEQAGIVDKSGKLAKHYRS